VRPGGREGPLALPFSTFDAGGWVLVDGFWSCSSVLVTDPARILASSEVDNWLFDSGVGLSITCGALLSLDGGINKSWGSVG
jgi:hypothetical protein